MDATTIEKMPRYSEHALKVAEIHQSKSKLHKSIRMLSALTGVGLGLLGSPLTIAAVATFSINELFNIGSAESEILKSWSIKHKFKRVARRVNKMYGTKLSFRCDYNNRTAGFVLCDKSGSVPISEYLTRENIHDHLSPEIYTFFMDSLEWELQSLNSFRGKDSKRMREMDLKDMPKIGLDNIQQAFDHVGGILSNQELLKLSMGSSLSKIEYKNFMDKHRKEELWTFSANLSEYLRNISGMNINDKLKLLIEFRYHFEKYGEEGMQQFNKLVGQIEEEQRINKTL